MPTTRRGVKKAAVSKLQSDDMQTATELDMLAAVATSVHLENEQAEQQKSKSKKSNSRSKRLKEEILMEVVLI